MHSVRCYSFCDYTLASEGRVNLRDLHVSTPQPFVLYTSIVTTLTLLAIFYSLCWCRFPLARHEEGQSCRYSHVVPNHNYCTFAHSLDELDEWKERFRWREMKRKAAAEDNLYSYMAKLVEDYKKSGCEVVGIRPSLYSGAFPLRFYFSSGVFQHLVISLWYFCLASLAIKLLKGF